MGTIPRCRLPVVASLPTAPGRNRSFTSFQLSRPWPGGIDPDPAGNIYGVTAGGGVNDAGSVYSLNRATGWQERLLLSFDGYPYRRGLSPQGAITFDANGNLYGSTILGGAYDCGVTYKLMRPGKSCLEGDRVTRLLLRRGWLLPLRCNVWPRWEPLCCDPDRRRRDYPLSLGVRNGL